MANSLFTNSAPGNTGTPPGLPNSSAGNVLPPLNFNAGMTAAGPANLTPTGSTPGLPGLGQIPSSTAPSFPVQNAPMQNSAPLPGGLPSLRPNVSTPPATSPLGAPGASGLPSTTVPTPAVNTAPPAAASATASATTTKPKEVKEGGTSLFGLKIGGKKKATAPEKPGKPGQPNPPNGKANAAAKKKNPLIAVATFVFLGIAVLSSMGYIILKTNLFAPQANENIEPRNIKVTNINGNSFTVSFITTDPVISMVKYGSNPSDNALVNRVYDDRNKNTPAESMEPFTSHYITVEGLSPQTTYYFKITITDPNAGFGARPIDYSPDDGPLQTTTFARNTLTNSITTYGTVTENGKPVPGALVYAAIETTIDGEVTTTNSFSKYVESNGNWRMPMSQIYNQSTRAPIQVDPEASTLSLKIEHPGSGKEIDKVVPLSEAMKQPIATDFVRSAAPTDTPATATPGASTPGQTNPSQESSTTIIEDNSSTTVDMTKDNIQTLTSTSPEITGQVSPGEKVTVEIKKPAGTTASPSPAGGASTQETVVYKQEVTADSTGKYTIPSGSVTPPLTDGNYTVTQTRASAPNNPTNANITVYTAGGATYGSGNPVPPPSPSPTPAPTPEPTPEPPTPTPTPEPTPEPEPETPKSGVIEDTLFLILAGVFFICVSMGSYLLIRRDDE